MRKFLVVILAIAVVFSFPGVCFATDGSTSVEKEADWEQMMDIAKETFPELQADIQYAVNHPLMETRNLITDEVTASEQIVFQEVRETADRGVLCVTKYESGMYSFLYSADWITYKADGSARIASFQVWYAHIRVVVSVHSLKFVFTPGGNDYFTDTGYAVCGAYSQEWPTATKRSEDSSGPAYSLFEVQWSAEILGQPIFETMGIKIEVGGDSVAVYVNGNLVL